MLFRSNAVEPSGASGVDAMSDGALIHQTAIIGIGALAIGQLKYKTQQTMLQQMLATEQPMHLAYNHAFEVAKQLLASE